MRYVSQSSCGVDMFRIRTNRSMCNSSSTLTNGISRAGNVFQLTLMAFVVVRQSNSCLIMFDHRQHSSLPIFVQERHQYAEELVRAIGVQPMPAVRYILDLAIRIKPLDFCNVWRDVLRSLRIAPNKQCFPVIHLTGHPLAQGAERRPKGICSLG